MAQGPFSLQPSDTWPKKAGVSYRAIQPSLFALNSSDWEQLGVIGLWLFSLVASIGFGLASIVNGWSGIPLHFGGVDLFVTIYPPLVICTFWTLLFGFWWGFIPAYMATLVLAIYSGMPLGWSLLFAFADPLGLAVLAIAYQAIPISYDLRSYVSVLFFILVSFIGSVLGASGSIIWIHATETSLEKAFSIWQGWWLGAFLQTIFIVGPLLFLITPIFSEWRDRHIWTRAHKGKERGTVTLFLTVILCGIFIYLAMSYYLSSWAIAVSERASSAAQWKQAALFTAESTQAVFGVLALLILALSYIGYQFFMYWTASLAKSAGDLFSANENLRNEINERERAEAQLVGAKETAEKASRAKTKFLASANHDLRQPIQALALLVGTLRLILSNERSINEEEVIEKSLSIVDKIDSSQIAMTSLMEALLDISKLDAGVIVPEIENFNIGGLLERLADDYEKSADLKGISLNIVQSSAVVKSDPVLVSRILSNLVSNALKFTDKGKILIGCRHHGYFLNIQVLDTGKGIPEDGFVTIFEEFKQLDNPARQREKGLGLGLAIVKQISQLLGFEIKLQSHLGKGSHFSFDLPLVSHPVLMLRPKKYPTEPKALPVNKVFNGLKVIILEDDPMVSTPLITLLNAFEMDAIGFTSVEDALSVIDNDTQAPDFIIADNQLLGQKNGAEGIDLMRRRFNKNIPAIIISGNTEPEHIEKYKQLGLAFYPKPITPQSLVSVIEESISKPLIE